MDLDFYYAKFYRNRSSRFCKINKTNVHLRAYLDCNLWTFAYLDPDILKFCMKVLKTKNSIR